MTSQLDWSRRMIFLISCGIFGLTTIIWFLTAFAPFVAGLMLGEIVSLFNVWYLAHRVKLVGKRIVNQTPRLGGSGLATRILMVIFAALLAYRFPEWIDIRSYVFALPISYIVMLIVGGLNVKRMKKIQEGRDVIGNHSKD